MATKLTALILIAVITFGVSGCQLGYVFSQGTEQLRVVWNAVDIEDLHSEMNSDSTLDTDQHLKLKFIADVKSFAEEEIGLEVGDAYTTFYEIGEEPISYIVSAAHPLALVPYMWSFPFVGKVTYKGFFEEEDALAEENRLQELGWDTAVTSVAAFSTLGWFRDPVLSSMLDFTEYDLAELILHELVHRTIYFKDNTAVNESMATVVARVSARIFLTRKHGEESQILEDYQRALEERKLRTMVLSRLRKDLDALYRSGIADSYKHRRKAELFSTASSALSYLDPDSPPRVISPSNARVLSTGQYHKYVPFFQEVLKSFDGQPKLLMSFLKGIPISDDPIPIITSHIERKLKSGEGSGS